MAISLGNGEREVGEGRRKDYRLVALCALDSVAVHPVPVEGATFPILVVSSGSHGRLGPCTKAGSCHYSESLSVFLT